MNLPDTSVALVGALSLGSFSRGILACSRLRAIFFARVSPRVLGVCGSLKSPYPHTGPCVIRAGAVPKCDQADWREARHLEGARPYCALGVGGFYDAVALCLPFSGFARMRSFRRTGAGER